MKACPPVRRSRTSDIDRFLGHRIKQLRLLACMTQQHVAAQLGVSPQQVCKLEAGIDRVSAAQLLLIARFLEVPMTELFEGYDHSAPRDPFDDAETSRMLRDLAHVFRKLEPKQQEALAHLARALAANDQDSQTAYTQEASSPHSSRFMIEEGGAHDNQ
jgi:transcriptional regulator with XRE-family HTH domain